MGSRNIRTKCMFTLGSSAMLYEQKWSRDEVRRRLDNSKWLKVRARVLRRQPNCVNCLRFGILTPATDVDHKIPKRATNQDMWYKESNLQPLCKHCHDTHKFEIENQGYCTDIGADGVPIDPNHPQNKKKVLSLDEYRAMLNE